MRKRHYFDRGRGKGLFEFCNRFTTYLVVNYVKIESERV